MTWEVPGWAGWQAGWPAGCVAGERGGSLDGPPAWLCWLAGWLARNWLASWLAAFLPLGWLAELEQPELSWLHGLLRQLVGWLPDCLAGGNWLAGWTCMLGVMMPPSACWAGCLCFLAGTL